MNGDLKYGEITIGDIEQFLINQIPDILDYFFTDKPTPYGSPGPSMFIQKYTPNIETFKAYYIPKEKVNEAIIYFNKIKEMDYIDPKSIKY